MGILKNVFEQLEANGGDIDKLDKEGKDIILRYSRLHSSVDRVVSSSDGNLYRIVAVGEYKGEYIVVYRSELGDKEQYIKSVEEFICSKNSLNEYDIIFLNPSKCAVKDCECKVMTRGYCRKHYLRIYKNGITYSKHIIHKDKECSVEGCTNKIVGKGYCDKHYKEFKKYGKVESLEERQKRLTCTVEGCNEKHVAKGLCNKHYNKMFRDKKKKEENKL